MSAITQPEVTALTVIERAELALDATKTAADLRALVAQSQSITAITNRDGRDECHRAAMVAKNARIAVEKTSKEARDEATRFCKGVISIERDLVGIIAPEETRLIALRNGWDDARAAERAAAEQAEWERVAAIRKRIDAIRDLPLELVSKSIAQIAADIHMLECTDVADDFAEFTGEAIAVRDASLSKMKTLLASAREVDEVVARMNQRIAAERAAREEAERQAAEARRIADEEAAKARAEAKKREQERQIAIAAERAELARQAAEAKRVADEEAAKARAEAAAQKAAEQAALNAERDKLDAERAEFAARVADQLRQANEALAKEEAAQAAIRAEEERKAAEQQAEIDRQQAIIDAAEREKRMAAEAAEAGRQHRAAIAALTPPDADAIIAHVADHFAGGDYDTAQKWLMAMDFSA